MHANNMSIPSKLREKATSGKINKVIPDGLGLGVHSEGRVANFVVEVKAVNGELHSSSNAYQILGEIDVAASLTTGGANPQLAFFTTSNTVIGEDIKAYVEEKGVFISQYIAQTDGEGAITIGAPMQLNMWDRPFLSILIPGVENMIGPSVMPDRAFDNYDLEDLLGF